MNPCRLITSFSGLAILFSLSACEKDEAAIPESESELITTVIATFTPTTGSARVFKWSDKDGAGGLAPVIQSIALPANSSFTVSLVFLDESKSPVVDITPEIQEESKEHLVCYTSSGAFPAVTITDQDARKRPLGLLGTLKTDAAGSGSLRVVLKHEPDKKSATPCNTGETDVEVSFPASIN